MWLYPPAHWLMRPSISPLACLQSTITWSHLNNQIFWQLFAPLKDVLIWFLQTENIDSSERCTRHPKCRNFPSKLIAASKFSRFSSAAKAQSFNVLDCFECCCAQLANQNNRDKYSHRLKSTLLCSVDETHNLVNKLRGFRQPADQCD